MNPNYTPTSKIFATENTNGLNDATIQRKHQKKEDELKTYAKTQRVVKKVVLYDNQLNKHKFVVYKDKEIGMPKIFENTVMESWNDDDKRTSTTQMQRGMVKTLEDLYDELEHRNGNQNNKQYSQASYEDTYYATQ